jgi:hypothetical protein
LKTTAGRLLRVGLLVLPIALAGGREALACASCYGLADGPLIDAARLGVFLLLGVVLAVQGGFLAFFLYLRRRAAKAADEALDAEWSRLQHSWSRAGRGI